MLCIVLVLLFAGCGKDGDTSKVEIDYGTSSVYSKEEIDSAIEIIKKQFASFEGCELHSLSYMPDEECNNADNIEWMNNLRTDDNKEAFTQCIAFESSFRSPEKGGGAWEANEEYTWSVAQIDGRGPCGHCLNQHIRCSLCAAGRAETNVYDMHILSSDRSWSPRNRTFP